MLFGLGIDIGATALKVAVVNDQGQALGAWSCPLQGQSAQVVRAFLEEAPWRDAVTADRIVVGVTGSGRDIFSGAVKSYNELVALARGISVLSADACSAIEIGGHTARWIMLGAKPGELAEFGQNQLCAAGSGVFLEQQAGRLRLSTEALAELAANASHGATVAGRCSVFAKSDMIHLQQKGTPVEEIAYGLCLAMARNFMATVLKGRDLPQPLMLAGGGAANAGLVRAFREVLSLPPEHSVRSPHPGCEAAFGAAALALHDNGPSHAMNTDLVATLGVTDAPQAASDFAPLVCMPRDKGAIVPPDGEMIEAFLGVDVGSVSTNFVVLDSHQQVREAIYLPTRGRPIEVLNEALEHLATRFGDHIRILGVAVTGSGRHLAAALLGADMVRNEITCQAAGTIAAYPKADTILEIGGQDSKFVSLANGRIRDFMMNKICAAGTGSFLEEQAEYLGVKIIGDFAERAAVATQPADLGCQCTVFMQSELVAAQRRGTSTEDLCAGLAYAVARNYLDRVVAGRPIGEEVVFQGGVASNDAVVAAFEALLERPVRVHPYNGVSGALGAATLIMAEAPPQSRFRGFQSCHGHSTRSFECRHCANRCQVSRISIDGKAVHFGDACERFASRDADERGMVVPDALALRKDIVDGLCPQLENPKGTIGFPATSVLLELQPFWATFFHHLNYRLLISPPSSQATLQAGIRRLPAETCLPVKLTFGHVLALLHAPNPDREADQLHVFLPSITTLPGDNPFLSHSCPYVQSVPFMVKAAMDASRIFAPEVDLQADERRFLNAMAEVLDRLAVSRSQAQEAFLKAQEAQSEYRLRMIEAGRGLLSEYDRVFVVVGKPYNVLDAFLNLNLFKHLRRLGQVAMPMWFLPLEEAKLDESLSNLPWHFNREIAKALTLCKNDPRLFPVLVSNFGCGPDAFTHGHLEQILGDKHYLSLEFDEHRGEAGLITRIEAFLDEIGQDAGNTETPHALRLPSTALMRRPMAERNRRFVIPYFSDHAYAFSGALKAAGHESRLLPQPNDAVRRLGEAHASGKECHPYALLAGDLVALAQSERAGDEAFFFPGTTIPCLLHQYGDGHRLLLQRLGIHDLEVVTPNALGLRDLLGFDNTIRLWQGLVAIDLLIKATCEIRPYEKEIGQTDAIHQQNLQDIETATAAGELGSALALATARLKMIAVDRSEVRPLVGVAGDIYTRINPAGNENLFHWLEAQGLEVWPSPFMVDIIDFGWRRDIDLDLGRGRYAAAALSSILMMRKNLESWLIQRQLKGQVNRIQEPSYKEVLEMATPYLGKLANEALMCNVAKMVDFARRGADGVINAVCFNCMLGTISASVTQRIRDEHQGIPIANLFYNRVEGSQRSVLEAFVHQVQARQTQRLAAEVPRERSRFARLLGA